MRLRSLYMDIIYMKKDTVLGKLFDLFVNKRGEFDIY